MVAMYQVPRVALIQAVEQGKQAAADILQLQMRVSLNYISEDEAVDKYQILLQRVEAIRGLAEQAQAAMFELSPPNIQPLPEGMTLGLAELRALDADLRSSTGDKQKVNAEIARINGEQIMPAAAAWYAQSVGKFGAVDVDSSGTKCLSEKRIVTLGPSGRGVSAAAITMPILD
jgi:hypothetical protein